MTDIGCDSLKSDESGQIEKLNLLVTGSLEKLTELYIGDNQLNGIDAIPSSISRLSQLTVFHASGNFNLEGIPIEMKVMNQIEEVIHFNTTGCGYILSSRVVLVNEIRKVFIGSTTGYT